MRIFLLLSVLFLILTPMLFAQDLADVNQKNHVQYYEELDSSLTVEVAGMLIQGIKYNDQDSYREEIKLSLADNVLSNGSKELSKEEAVKKLSGLYIEENTDIYINVAGLDRKTNEWTVKFLTDNGLLLTVTISNENSLVTSFTIPTS